MKLMGKQTKKKINKLINKKILSVKSYEECNTDTFHHTALLYYSHNTLLITLALIALLYRYFKLFQADERWHLNMKYVIQCCFIKRTKEEISKGWIRQ